MFRVISGHAEVRLDGAQRHPRDAGAARPPGAAAGQDADARAGDQGRRHRRRGQAEGHADERPARRQGDRRSRVPPIKFPEPVISYAIEPKSRGDEEKISTALHRLQEEDPTISYNRDAQTKELLLAGQGQSHIEVTVAKLKRRFGVEVNLKLPRIPYRETITASTEAHGRHKKQTGGHGQFGDCKVKFEPLPRGSDFEFVDDIFGGSIPRQFIPAVEKGHPGRAACAASSPATRWSTSAPRCSTARSTRSTRTSCRSRWPARWRSRTACHGRGRRCSSRSWTSRSTRRATTPAI